MDLDLDQLERLAAEHAKRTEENIAGRKPDDADVAVLQAWVTVFDPDTVLELVRLAKQNTNRTL